MSRAKQTKIDSEMVKWERKFREQENQRQEKERQFFIANPLHAAYWILPAIGSCSSLARKTGNSIPNQVEFLLKDLIEMPCPAWALKQALEETRRDRDLPFPADFTEERAQQVRETWDMILAVPQEFWDALWEKLP